LIDQYVQVMAVNIDGYGDRERFPVVLSHGLGDRIGCLVGQCRPVRRVEG